MHMSRAPVYKYRKELAWICVTETFEERKVPHVLEAIHQLGTLAINYSTHDMHDGFNV